MRYVRILTLNQFLLQLLFLLLKILRERNWKLLNKYYTGTILFLKENTRPPHFTHRQDVGLYINHYVSLCSRFPYTPLTEPPPPCLQFRPPTHTYMYVDVTYGSDDLYDLVHGTSTVRVLLVQTTRDPFRCYPCTRLPTYTNRSRPQTKEPVYTCRHHFWTRSSVDSCVHHRGNSRSLTRVRARNTVQG